ncbi:MAG TPA: TlpA disulfide reductase family protein [Fimbriimonas sp.]
MNVRRVLAFAAVLVLVGCAEEARRSASPPTAPPLGAAAAKPAEPETFPDFTLPTLDGKKWRLSDARGKVTVLNYWATWCPPCVEETPELVRAANEFGDRVRFVGISIDYGQPEAVRRFVEKYKIPYPILMPKEGDPTTARLTGVPETYVLDQQGKLVGSFIGAVSRKELESKIKPLLEEKNL